MSKPLEKDTPKQQISSPQSWNPNTQQPNSLEKMGLSGFPKALSG